MNKIALTLTLLLASCATTKSAAPVTWPAIVQCSAPADGQLLDRVVAILLGGDDNAQVISESAIGQLEQLAVDHAASAVVCMVDMAIASLQPASQARSSLSRDGTEPVGEPVLTEPTQRELAGIAAAARGRDFLRRVGTAVESGE